MPDLLGSVQSAGDVLDRFNYHIVKEQLLLPTDSQ